MLLLFPMMTLMMDAARVIEVRFGNDCARQSTPTE